MSKVTHREQITSVTQQLSDGLQELTREVAASVQDLQATAQEAVRDVTADIRDDLRESESLTGCEALANRQDTVRSEIRERLDGSVSELEAIQAETLGALQVAEPLESEDACAVEAALDQLSRARSVADARQLQQEALDTVREGHRRLFIDNLALCVEQASLSIGFTQVSVSEGPGGETRVAATNEKGQTIVSEIRDDGDGDPSLASEILGVFDDACEDIMDRFEDALSRAAIEHYKRAPMSVGALPDSSQIDVPPCLTEPSESPPRTSAPN